MSYVGSWRRQLANATAALATHFARDHIADISSSSFTLFQQPKIELQILTAMSYLSEHRFGIECEISATKSQQ